MIERVAKGMDFLDGEEHSYTRTSIRYEYRVFNPITERYQWLRLNDLKEAMKMKASGAKVRRIIHAVSHTVDTL
jgi:hypothetical protein